MTVVIGIDPGGRDTGLVVRDGRRLVRAVTVHRATLDRPAYLAEVVDTADDLVAHARPLDLAAIGVEDVNEPTGFADGERHPISLEPLLTTAAVMGAILGRFSGVLVVPPAGNGQGPLQGYPAELVGPREQHGRYGTRRHLRSAWDVAGVALMLLRQSTPLRG